jgi:putative acyl-CoA dehydrogenase
VLRAVAREPATVEAFATEVGTARGADARLDAAADRLAKDLTAADEGSARRLVESMALVLQGSLLVRYAPAYVADAFCASRLGEEGHRLALGTLPGGLDLAPIIDRASPKLAAPPTRRK